VSGGDDGYDARQDGPGDGANHGIGAATAVALARRGCAVVCAYLRLQDEVDPGTPQAYRDHRSGTADAVVAQIEAAGSHAVAIEADLSDPATPAVLFDAAEERFGPVSILVNNATGCGDAFLESPCSRMASVLHFVPDGDDPAGIIAELAAALAPGSLIAISHHDGSQHPAWADAA
jgi:3-oxoacyl-[acyl-carrier protein] reductase